jgi:hypothetical protein
MPQRSPWEKSAEEHLRYGFPPETCMNYVSGRHRNSDASLCMHLVKTRGSKSSGNSASHQLLSPVFHSVADIMKFGNSLILNFSLQRRKNISLSLSLSLSLLSFSFFLRIK